MIRRAARTLLASLALCRVNTLRQRSRRSTAPVDWRSTSAVGLAGGRRSARAHPRRRCRSVQRFSRTSWARPITRRHSEGGLSLLYWFSDASLPGVAPDGAPACGPDRPAPSGDWKDRRAPSSTGGSGAAARGTNRANLIAQMLEALQPLASASGRSARSTGVRCRRGRRSARRALSPALSWAASRSTS